MAKEKKQFRQLSDEELEKVTGGKRDLFCEDSICQKQGKRIDINCNCY